MTKFRTRQVRNSYADNIITLVSTSDMEMEVIASIKETSNEKYKQQTLLVEWLMSPNEIAEFIQNHEHTTIELNTGKDDYYNYTYYMTVNDHSIYGSAYQHELSPKDIMDIQQAEQKSIIITDDEETYQQSINATIAGRHLISLYNQSPIFTRIIAFDENQKPSIQALSALLFTLSDEKQAQYISALRYSNGNIRTLETIAKKLIDDSNLENGVDLMTQEQQVEAFISYSKLVADAKIEILPDTTIDAIKESAAYQSAVSKITDRGFGISKTQQFNVLQSVGYLTRPTSREKFMYNLSDMGAGKTLMTVESIFVVDYQSALTIKQNIEQDERYTNTNIRRMYLPSKNLIAPKLSITSSWVSTFEMFYDVEKQSDTHYVLSFDVEGQTFYTDLFVAPFTARTNAITVDAKLPETKVVATLIIDELHQLVSRPISKTKFFESPSAKGSIADEYDGYILSGTLSNLTTTEWFNYVSFMGMKFYDNHLDNGTPASLGNALDSERLTLNQQIHDSAENISVEQRRDFDPTGLEKPQMHVPASKKQTNKAGYYQMRYGAKLIQLDNNTTDIQTALINGQFNTISPENIIDTPNFELFYQLVGNSAITAQSTQIAEELFGEQKKQHNAQVINVPSTLSADDILILKTLHDITKDYRIYKSQAIATDINNAILNLNDGLIQKNVYEILGGHAQRNIRFLEYLSTLDINVLEKLPESGLIAAPELSETPKFKILKDIIDNEPDETYLIVVNDYQSAARLSKELGVTSLTRKQTTSALDYQDVLDSLFEEQSIVVVPQMMIKSSLDLVQANRLIQYQLNTEISDIIQTQNRINRIGQTRETKAFYIATDSLQKNIIDLFLETYKNIRVAHKGIVELFVDMSTQVTVVNDYIAKAMQALSPDTDMASNDEPIAVESNMEEPFISDNGDILLFDTAPYITHDTVDEAIDIDESQSDDIRICKGQLNLFMPIEIAIQHQLRPAI